ncbi:alcohol dehydrogenase catalytic domain-containing protein [Streptomyces sp. NPDC001980]|uniref:alcohol dehydrogenase catalytic domain-containing protein n=1 Tax=Streptomyces sp. NPDC001980 TaxID=3157126 RepID=UPI003330ADF1
MHACVLHAVQDLRVEEFTPSAPAPGEVAVSVAFGGICGSDLHYYRHGRVGDFTVREPMVLGHEGAAEVVVSDLVEEPLRIARAQPLTQGPENEAAPDPIEADSGAAQQVRGRTWSGQVPRDLRSDP